jgi:hypothetical protein
VEVDEITRDMAMIATALAYSETQKKFSGGEPSIPSKWVLSGRAAAMQNSV